MSLAERKTKVDRCHKLPISRQCDALAISRSSAYRVAAGLSMEELDHMRKLDELHLCYPFKGSRRLRDDLWDDEMVSSPLITGVTMRQDGDILTTIKKRGEDHDKDYDNWAGFGKKDFSCHVL